MLPLIFAQIDQQETILIGVGIGLYAVGKAIEIVKSVRGGKVNEQVLQESIARTDVLRRLLEGQTEQRKQLDELQKDMALAMERQVTKDTLRDAVAHACKFRHTNA